MTTSIRLARAFSGALIVLLAGTALATAAAWFDPFGDVTSPNADMISGSANISGGMVDLRVNFGALPFPTTQTQDLVWFFDIDRNPSTPPDGYFPPGADLSLQLEGFTGAGPYLVGIPGVDLCTHTSVDPATHTIRVSFPASLLPSQAGFNYFVESNFGGSFGRIDLAPDQPDFTSLSGFFLSTTFDLPPFDGVPFCTEVEIDVSPENADDTIRFDKPSPVKVALFSHEGFLAPTDAIQSTLRFGASRRDGASPISCAVRDVDHDGLKDLVCSFDPRMMDLVPGDTVGLMFGQTTIGTLLTGSTDVIVVDPGP